MGDELDDVVRRALHDARLDLAVEFHIAPDGSKSGAIQVRDDRGASVARVVLGSAEELNAALARLVVLGFAESDAAPRLEAATPPSPRSTSRVDASVLVAGVDGFRKGWVAVSLDPSGDVEVSKHADFEEVLSLRAKVIAVDIPIDPEGRGSRPTDAAARAFVGPRASSVFPAPPRLALQAPTFAEACEVARAITGKAISQQAFALGRKILEVQERAEEDERVIEMHPEVSFCELAGSQLLDSKHTPDGLDRRRALLADAGIRLPGAVPGVPEADLLDAAVGAWTAARYASGKAVAFPPSHTDRLGAIWR